MSSSSESARQGSRPGWAGNPPHAAAARARLLEATSRCIARDGVAATSVAAVAAEAAVSRQTVYRYFSGREQLVKRAIFAAAGALQAKIAEHVAPLSDPADMIVEALVLGLEELRADPVLRGIWDSASPDGLVTGVFTDPAGIAWIRGALARAVESAGWDGREADTSMEFVLRVALSLLVSPEPERSDEELRAFLYRYLVPGLGLAVSEEI